MTSLDSILAGGLSIKKSRVILLVISVCRKEEKEYKKWLAGQKDDLADDDAKKELKPLRDFWNSDHLDQNEKFLRDYILNKGKLTVWTQITVL